MSVCEKSARRKLVGYGQQGVADFTHARGWPSPPNPPHTRLISRIEQTQWPGSPGRIHIFARNFSIGSLKKNSIIWASNIKSYDEVLRYIHEKVRYEFQTKDGQGWKTCILHNEQSLWTTTDGGLTKFASVKTWSLTRRFSMRLSGAFWSMKNDCTRLRYRRMSVKSHVLSQNVLNFKKNQRYKFQKFHDCFTLRADRVRGHGIL